MMSPRERADLLRHGVVLDTITALEIAGYSTLGELRQLDRQQLIAIAGVGEYGADTIRRALGQLMNAAVAQGRTTR